MVQVMVKAFPWNTAPTYLVRDNDGAYGQAFLARIRTMGIRNRPISPRSPWQNPYAERLIGTLRRDCLDHILIFGERHLLRIPVFIFSLLQPDAHALGVGQRHAATTGCSTNRDHRRDAGPIWIASSLCPDIFSRRTRPEKVLFSLF